LEFQGGGERQIYPRAGVRGENGDLKLEECSKRSGRTLKKGKKKQKKRRGRGTTRGKTELPKVSRESAFGERGVKKANDPLNFLGGRWGTTGLSPRTGRTVLRDGLSQGDRKERVPHQEREKRGGTPTK